MTGRMGFTAGLLVLVATAGTARAGDRLGLRPTVAMVDFEGQPAGRILPPPRMGATAAGLMVDRLVQKSQFRVFDGHWLVARREKGLDLDAMREGARAAGMNYLVVGEVTRFSQEHKERSAGALAFIVPAAGLFHRERTELVVAITVRLVDVGTGEIVATATGTGSAGRANTSVGGIGIHGLAGGGSRSTNSADALLDEALRFSVEEAAASLSVSSVRIAELSSAGQRRANP